MNKKMQNELFNVNRRAESDARHHWIFDQFEGFRGQVPTNFHVAFIGDRVRDDVVDWEGGRSDLLAAPSYPEIDEEYFEWISILQAVKDAGKSFCMLELGAGYVRWAARAAFAAKYFNKQLKLGLAEPDPKNRKLLVQHMKDNFASPHEYKAKCCF